MHEWPNELVQKINAPAQPEFYLLSGWKIYPKIAGFKDAKQRQQKCGKIKNLNKNTSTGITFLDRETAADSAKMDLISGWKFYMKGGTIVMTSSYIKSFDLIVEDGLPLCKEHRNRVTFHLHLCFYLPGGKEVILFYTVFLGFSLTPYLVLHLRSRLW